MFSYYHTCQKPSERQTDAEIYILLPETKHRRHVHLTSLVSLCLINAGVLLCRW